LPELGVEDLTPPDEQSTVLQEGKEGSQKAGEPGAKGEEEARPVKEEPEGELHSLFCDPYADVELVSNDGVILRYSSFLLVKNRCATLPYGAANMA
jgi:hypothetical protein